MAMYYDAIISTLTAMMENVRLFKFIHQWRFPWFNPQS
jgi:hypothetical protein